MITNFTSELLGLLKNAPCACPECGGDGKETCTNPDHGLISAMGFHEIGRLGCPVCGHDPNHKVKSGGPCLECEGSGKVTLGKSIDYCGDDLLQVIDYLEAPPYRKFLMDAADLIAKAKAEGL